MEETHSKVVRTPMGENVDQDHQDNLDAWLHERRQYDAPFEIIHMVQSQGEGGITTTIIYEGMSDEDMHSLVAH